MNQIGLIGFGRFGQLLHRHLKAKIRIQVYDPAQMSEHRADDTQFAALTDVCQNHLLILAVPVTSFLPVCREIAPFLSQETVVMDVCAVKEYPVRIMEKVFPRQTEIVGTHPLFGPDSARDSLTDHIMIVTPHRISEPNWQDFKTFWESTGIRLSEMTPGEQDRLMAWTLALTHFLGRGLTNLPLPDTQVATRDYQNLMHLTSKINRDTWELFQDMHRFNPYTREMREKLLASFSDLKNQLDLLSPDQL